ncbi:hypothetical protein K438DRAFT_1965208 [Mycena galopus ATCC 62051]|nr:hypothetical protein K438DRAFT_1965208 [Mycena galopus ATCC 62051]
MEGKGEVSQGQNMVDAAKEAGMKIFIWTSLHNVIVYDDKDVVQQYLKSSGLVHASFLLSGSLANLWAYHTLSKTADGYNAFALISRDVPTAALILLKSYTDPAEQVNGKAYTPECPRENSPRGLGKVTFKTAPDTGMAVMHGMLEALAMYGGFYHKTPIRNPDLEAAPHVRPAFSSVHTLLGGTITQASASLPMESELRDIHSIHQSMRKTASIPPSTTAAHRVVIAKRSNGDKAASGLKEEAKVVLGDLDEGEEADEGERDSYQELAHDPC